MLGCCSLFEFQNLNLKYFALAVCNCVMARAWDPCVFLSEDCPGNPGVKVKGKRDAAIHDEQVEGRRVDSICKGTGHSPV